MVDPLAWHGAWGIDADRWISTGNWAGTIHPVAEKEPNPWGFFDVLGNVGEFVSDAMIRDNTLLPRIDPFNAATPPDQVPYGGNTHSYRGSGSHVFNFAAFRLGMSYNEWRIGFRLVRTDR